MQNKQQGITALVTAFARAWHAQEASPRIFDDFLAKELFSLEEQNFFKQNIANIYRLVHPKKNGADEESALAWVMQNLNGAITLSRSRFCEDSLKEASLSGIRQTILLGAGLDTFAWRRPDWAAGLKVFEVDHPLVQEMKKERLNHLGWDLTKAVFLPLDFTSQSLAEGLQGRGYKPDKKSFISWLGVSFYLPAEAVLTMIRSLAEISPPGSQLVFDVMEKAAFDPLKAHPRSLWMQTIVSNSGEPMQSGFDREEMVFFLENTGFRVLEYLSPLEIEDRYFSGRTDDYHAFPHVYFIRAERV